MNVKGLNAGLLSKIEKIKVVLTDVDGVLTDGGMIYNEDGLFMKRFNVKDGMGAALLKQAGFKVGLISTDVSPIGKIRGERLNFDFVVVGSMDKVKSLDQICAELGIGRENCAFMGDDVNDLQILKSVGFSAAPADAVPEIAEAVDYVCTKNGGQGAYREYADIIRKNKNS